MQGGALSAPRELRDGGGGRLPQGRSEGGEGRAGQGGGRTRLTARGRRPPGARLRERRRTPRCRCRRPWRGRAAPCWAEQPAAQCCGAAATSGQDGTGRRGPSSSRESEGGTAPRRAEVREGSGSRVTGGALLRSCCGQSPALKRCSGSLP